MDYRRLLLHHQRGHHCPVLVMPQPHCPQTIPRTSSCLEGKYICRKVQVSAARQINAHASWWTLPRMDRYTEDADLKREAANDAWTFSVSSNKWTQVAYAPGDMPRVSARCTLPVLDASQHLPSCPCGGSLLSVVAMPATLDSWCRSGWHRRQWWWAIICGLLPGTGILFPPV